MQIEPLGIEKITGYSKETVKEAYDEVLDFLTLPGKEFSTGVFAFSENGKSHFEDCKKLFNLNAIAFCVSAVAICLMMLIKKRIRPSKIFGMHYLTASGAGVLTTFAAVGILASLNFDKAFTVFHKIFFPGKDNWLFDTRTDQIINAMPEEFFMNCALLILTSVIVLSVGLIISGIIINKKQKVG